MGRYIAGRILWMIPTLLLMSLAIFVNDELTNRKPGYWKSYRDNIKKVTKEDVQRVAKKYLVPDKRAVLVIQPAPAAAAPGAQKEGQ